MAKSCEDILLEDFNKSNLKKLNVVNARDETSRVEQAFNDRTTELQAADKSWNENELNKWLANLAKVQLEDIIENDLKRIITQEKVNARIEQIREAKRMLDAEGSTDSLAEAYNSAHFLTNKTRNIVPLDKRRDAQGKAMGLDFVIDLQKYGPWKDQDIGSIPKTFSEDDFIREVFFLRQDLQKNKTIAPPTTPEASDMLLPGANKRGSREAFEFAKSYILKLEEESTMQSRLMGVPALQGLQNRLRVTYDYRMVKKAFKDVNEFVEFYSQKLHPDHEGHVIDSGDPFKHRKQLAKILYEKFLTNRNKDWRVQDAAVKEINNELKDYIRSSGLNQDQQYAAINKLPFYLKLADADSYIEVKDKLSRSNQNGVRAIVQRTIAENARILALVDFYGPDVKRGFESMQKWIREESDNYTKFSTNEIKLTNYIHQWVEEQINPSTRESGVGPAIISSLRNLETIKLSGGLITQIADGPTIKHVANKYGITSMDLVDSVFNINEFRGTKAEQNLFYTSVLDITEVFGVELHDRFNLVDANTATINQPILDKFSRGTAAFAHFGLKLNGFTWYTQAMPKMVASTMQRRLGDLVKTNVQYINLPDEFKYDFKVLGITEKQWNKIVELKPLTQSGLFDIAALKNRFNDDIKLPNEQLVATGNNPKKYSFEVNDLETKMITFINNFVERAGTKPDTIDRALTSGLQMPNTVAAELTKSLFQFKSFMLTFSRKILAKEYGDVIKGGNRITQVSQLALLGGLLTVTGAIVATLKQVIAGKQPYTLETAVQKGFQYINIVPYYQDLIIESGGAALWDSIITGRNEDKKSRIPQYAEVASRVLGPVANDLTKLGVSTWSILSGTVDIAKGRKKSQDLKDGIMGLGSLANDLNPLALSIWTKAVWRQTMHDWWWELFDKDGYRRSQKMMKQRAKQERAFGGVNIVDLQNPFK